MKKKNEGFSLVELIIVIAIMAILVGVMAPQLIKYIEKTNISSDTQLCDAVHSAIVTALSDPDVVTSTDIYDKNWVTVEFGTPNHNSRFDGVYGNVYKDSTFGLLVKEIVGYDIFDGNENRAHFKSKPSKTNGILCYQVNSTGNDFVIYIAHSDNSGQGRDINPLNGGSLEDVIHAPEN